MKKFTIYKNGERVVVLNYIEADTAEEAVRIAKEKFPKRLGKEILIVKEVMSGND